MLSSYRYTYYASGNQRSKTDMDGVVTSYVYDDLGRLVQEADTDGLTVDYTYDSAGNRIQMAVSGTENYTVEYTYDANNRLTQEVKTGAVSNEITVYTYDPNGNLLQKSNPNGAEFYQYNGFNQLFIVSCGSSSTVYAYNAQGIRTAKVTDDSATTFLLDGGDVIGEVEDGILTTTYLRGVNLIRRIGAEGMEYYLFNAHGDVVGLTDGFGAFVKSYDYDAFGNEENPDDSDTNPFRYCGEYFDKETGTYYLRARYYDPAIGRFTQQDSLLFTSRKLASGYECIDPLSLNLYAYCYNDPVRYSDPSGHMGYEALNELSELYRNNLITSQDVSLRIITSTGGNFYLALHQIAQVNLSKHLYNITGEAAVLEYRIDKSSRVDMVAGNRAWEVKPKGRSGAAQMLRYMLLGKFSAGEPLGPIDGIPIFDDIKMRIIPSATTPGVMHYELYRDTPEKAKVRVTNSQALKIWNKQFAMVLAGFGAIYIYTAATSSGKLLVEEICNDTKQE